jgi:TetR/AcrR family transcriptional repressor of mexJK operon
MSDGESRAGRGRPKDLAKREAIVRAANALFARDGLEAVSMDAVAEAAGVSKRTIYNHFRDKAALFEAVVAANGARITPLLGPATGVEDIGRRLVAVGIPLVEMMAGAEADRFGRLMIGQATRHPELVAGFYNAGPATMHRELAALLRRATEAGQLAVPDPDLAADQLVSMWMGQHHFRQLLGLVPPRTVAQIAARVEACVSMFLRAYAVDRPGRRRPR